MHIYMYATPIATAAKTQYIAYVKRAFELDAICRARATRDYAPPEGGRGAAAVLRWRYQCLLKPLALRLAAIGLGGLSAVVVWSEATIGLGKDPDLSPFSIVCGGGLLTVFLGCGCWWIEWVLLTTLPANFFSQP